MVQVIQNHTGADPHGLAIKIQVRDLPIITREIDDHAVTNRPTHQTGSSATRDHGHSGLSGRLDDGAGLASASRKCHRDGFDLIDGCVSRVELAGEVIERDVAMGTRECRLLLG